MIKQPVHTMILTCVILKDVKDKDGLHFRKCHQMTFRNICCVTAYVSDEVRKNHEANSQNSLILLLQMMPILKIILVQP